MLHKYVIFDEFEDHAGFNDVSWMALITQKGWWEEPEVLECWGYLNRKIRHSENFIHTHTHTLY